MNTCQESMLKVRSYRVIKKKFPREVVPRYRDPQLYVDKKYLHIESKQRPMLSSVSRSSS